jgi:hypothetical protein
MKTGHAALIAAALFLGCLLVAASVLAVNRHQYIIAPNDRLIRVDHLTGGVEVFDKKGRWVPYPVD